MPTKGIIVIYKKLSWYFHLFYYWFADDFIVLLWSSFTVYTTSARVPHMTLGVLLSLYLQLTPVQDKPFVYPTEDEMAFKCPTQVRVMSFYSILHFYSI